MELKSISEIRCLEGSEYDDYYRLIIENNPDFPSGVKDAALQAIRRGPVTVPAPQFVVEYFLAFCKENIDSMRWWSYGLPEAAISNDPGMGIFAWRIGNRRRCMIVSDETRTLIADNITALEGGIETELMQGLNIAALEANISSRREHDNYLTYLRLSDSQMEVIPEISGSLFVSEETARFSSAVWYEEIQKKTIILAGLGGIGSYVAFLLGRMHPRSLFLYDDDKVEAVNMAGQLFSNNDIGTFKVDAMGTMVRRYTNFNSIFSIREKFTEDKEGADIMLCGFDNMDARKTFFAVWLEHVKAKSEEERKHCLFIDGRLAAEEFQVLCIRGDDDYNIDRYAKEFLFSDEEADETLCSYKQTTYMANMIGSIIVNLFTNFVANEIEEGLRDLPFLTSYEADFMMFKTEQ